MLGIGLGSAGFSSKPDDPLFLVDLDHAEAARRLLHRHFVGRDRRGGALLDVPAQHLRVVHLVDVIPGKDHHMLGCFPHDRVQVLVHGVGGAHVPVVAHALLRRQDLDELTEFLGDDVPPHADVAIERQALVLRDDEDAAQAGVDAVAEREVDDPVGTAEVHRRLGAFPGQRREPFADPSGQDDDERVIEHGPPGPVRAEAACAAGRRAKSPCWGAAVGARGRQARRWPPGADPGVSDFGFYPQPALSRFRRFWRVFALPSLHHRSYDPEAWACRSVPGDFDVCDRFR